MPDTSSGTTNAFAALWSAISPLFAAFAASVSDYCTVPVGVKCDNKNGLAIAQAILAVKQGIDTVKTAVDGTTVPLDIFAYMIKNCGNDYGFTSNIKTTELH
ncbi:MAG: hypothetical protein IJO17_05760, partial [Alistipes sp.]|nr:hypothetical protein [Alistipes sp.]